MIGWVTNCSEFVPEVGKIRFQSLGYKRRNALCSLSLTQFELGGLELSPQENRRTIAHGVTYVHFLVSSILNPDPPI
ncbi:hypothetical protein F0562_033523 [Nyssa sinensis]|uniref:Uncharacterized protein n=1 Tax=Nyssa sinensis TaxID=561372 RepID=A0A5J5AFL8_9ASTE|nr:hypothetical protein F0562_033523 [Nyssa sinensis]